MNENVNKSTNILRSTTMTPTFGDLQPSDGSYSSFRATQPESGRLNVQVHRQRTHDWFSFPITHSERFDFWEKMNSDLTQFVWIHCDCFSSSPNFVTLVSIWSDEWGISQRNKGAFSWRPNRAVRSRHMETPSLI